MLSAKNVVRLILIAVLAVSVCAFVAMKKDIENTEAENSRLESDINSQLIIYNEYSAILDEDNLDDFNRDIAEKYLNLGDGGEKIYIDVTGQ